MLYLITYRVVDNEDVREEICEVAAFSEVQARFLAPCAPEDIVSVERVVSKQYAVIGGFHET